MTRGKKKKILVVTPTYPHSDKSTSVPGFVRDLCATLADNDYLVDVLAPHFEGAKPIARYNNITVYRFRYTLPGMHSHTQSVHHSVVAANHIAPIWRPFYKFFLLRKLTKLIKLYDYEAIHTHWLFPQGWAAAKACTALQKKTPLICSAYGLDLHPTEGAERHTRLTAVKYAKHTTVANHHALSQLGKMYPEVRQKLSILRIGVDLSTLFCRMPYVKRQKNALLFVGQLTAETGLSYLIRAMPLIQAQAPEVRLFVVGDGPERKQLELQAREYGCYQNMQFIGNLAPPAVALFYNKARMLVLPNAIVETDGRMQEGDRMAQICVEAMGCKCPVVAANLPPIKDILKDNHTGRLFEPGSPEAIANNVLWLLNHPKETKEFVSKAHATVQNSFGSDQIGTAYLSLLNNGLNRER
jgi:glycosyltransferase involved in cell wall biosynthesis